MKQHYCDFNINCHILVRFTEIGFQKLAADHNDFIGIIPNWEHRTAQYYKDRTDKDGFLSVQAWPFIQSFGPVTSIGTVEYYAATIKINQNDIGNISAWAAIKKNLKKVVKKIMQKL